MHRRAFLRTSTAVSALAVTATLPRLVSIVRADEKVFDPRPGTWRTFEITTRAEVLQPTGVTRVWLPLPGVNSEYQRTLGDRWSGNAKIMRPVTDGKYGASTLYAEFAEGEAAPVVELTSRFRTQNRAIDWSKKVAATADPAELRMWTQPTDLMPTDGIVKVTADEITQGKTTDVEKVTAIYDWILANTYREPKVRGCGVGDIKTMLETRNFGGKCGDINALFVGLVRAVGIPARDIYGIRVAPSAFGYKALGAGRTTAGWRWIPPTSARWRARRRASGSSSITRSCRRCARSSSEDGKATGSPSTPPTMSRFRTRPRAASSAS